MSESVTDRSENGVAVFALIGVDRVTCRCAWGAAPSARAAVVHEILQRGAHTLIAEQGCADTARCPGRRAHSVPANLGRIASPIRPDLIFDRDRVGLAKVGRLFRLGS